MHHFVTGVAGFIGSQLADCLLEGGDRVSGVDDFSLGRPEHLDYARQNPRFQFFERDISRPEQAIECLHAAFESKGSPDIIWHLAANSDIAVGVADASIDFRRTLQTTFAVVEAAKSEGVKKIAFASTSADYGERNDREREKIGAVAV